MAYTCECHEMMCLTAHMKCCNMSSSVI